jgi:hypothetical protein
VATHGRSFWILDDVSLVRQLAGQSSVDDITLFKPRDTLRYGSMFGFGHTPVPGKNYSFAATQVPAYMFEKDPDGQTKTIWLDAGENPPDGVIINYVLPSEPESEIELAILAEDGSELRSYKSKPKKDETERKDEKEFPPAEKMEEEEPDDAVLPAKAGLNRFIWDFRLAKATKIATKGGDQPGRDGPKVVPGTYQVRLTVGDKSRSESFTVLKDPLIPTTNAELQAQFDLIKAIHLKHDELNKGVNSIRSARTQATEWARRVKGSKAEASVVAAGKSLSEKLDAIEGELLQVKIKSEQDSLNYPVKLNTKLSALAGMVGGADAAPTKQASELYDDLAAKVDAQLKALKSVLATDLPAFNTCVAEGGVPAVVLADQN